MLTEHVADDEVGEAVRVILTSPELEPAIVAVFSEPVRVLHPVTVGVAVTNPEFVPLFMTVIV